MDISVSGVPGREISELLWVVRGVLPAWHAGNVPGRCRQGLRRDDGTQQIISLFFERNGMDGTRRDYTLTGRDEAG